MADLHETTRAETFNSCRSKTNSLNQESSLRYITSKFTLPEVCYASNGGGSISV